MGWLLKIYLLENLTTISILQFFTIGLLHSKEDKIFGILFIIYKAEFRFTFGLLKVPEIDKGVKANA